MKTSSRPAPAVLTPPNGHQAIRLYALTLAATVALLVAGTAAAAGANLSQAQQRYQQERAVCLSGQSNQDRATCLKEAGAALQEARRGGLDTGDDRDLGHNRMMRCMALPAQDREDCARRMHGEGVTTGSAQQGGVLRELARPVAPN
jgi:ATP/maltotriose-dependent transcriptional regulator MalT